jgi:CubicO group peptidase (beta-lactamase class C family)
MQYLYFMSPTYEVGSKFQYSNLGFIILGEVVKRITKRTLGDYYHQNQVFMSLKETMFNPSP